MTVNDQSKAEMHAVKSSSDPGASSVALRAPCDAPGSDKLFTACISALDRLLTVIPTSLLTDFSEGGGARHIGTGGSVITIGIMDLEQSFRTAARAAEAATSAAMEKYRHGHVTDEDDLTGILIGRLDSAFDHRNDSKNYGDIEWSSTILRHRRGIAAP